MTSKIKYLKIHILDVGHGDSIIIEFPDGYSFGIVDCCRNKKTNRGYKETECLEENEPKAITFFRHQLKQKKNIKIEFACLTHPHDDHYKGYADLLNWFILKNIPIKQYWDFGASSRKAKAMLKLAKNPEQIERVTEFENLCKTRLVLATTYNTEYRIISGVHRNFWVNNDVKIDTIAPNSSHIESYYNFLACNSESERRDFVKQKPWVVDDNIASSAFIIKYGDCRVLLGGDVTNEGWSSIINNRQTIDIKCDTIKVSHHGSLKGSFPFTKSVDEKIPLWPYLGSENRKLKAIISGGYRSGLPHSRTIDTLNIMNIPWFCTGDSNKIIRKFQISNNSNQDVNFHYEDFGIMEVEENYESGHGNIMILCNIEGRCSVSTEF